MSSRSPRGNAREAGESSSSHPIWVSQSWTGLGEPSSLPGAQKGVTGRRPQTESAAVLSLSWTTAGSRGGDPRQATPLAVHTNTTRMRVNPSNHAQSTPKPKGRDSRFKTTRRRRGIRVFNDVGPVARYFHRVQYFLLLFCHLQGTGTGEHDLQFN